jgi:hypothetical protein
LIIIFLEISNQNINSKDLGLSISKFLNSLWTPMADEFQFLSPEAGLKTEIKTNSKSWARAVGRWGNQRESESKCSLDFTCIWRNPFFFSWPFDSKFPPQIFCNRRNSFLSFGGPQPERLSSHSKKTGLVIYLVFLAKVANLYYILLRVFKKYWPDTVAKFIPGTQDKFIKR